MLAWLKSFLKKTKQSEPEAKDATTYDVLRIWGPVAGPFHRMECPDPFPEGCEYMLVCRIEVDGEMATHEYFFETFKDVQKILDHFHNKSDPIEVQL